MNEFDKRIFGKNLKFYMDKKGIDRKQLCNDTGFGYTTVSAWIQGKKYPRIDKIEKLANYFGIPKSYLIDERPDERRTALIERIEKIPESDIPRAEAVLSAVFDDIK